MKAIIQIELTDLGHVDKEGAKIMASTILQNGVFVYPDQITIVELEEDPTEEDGLGTDEQYWERVSKHNDDLE